MTTEAEETAPKAENVTANSGKGEQFFGAAHHYNTHGKKVSPYGACMFEKNGL